MCLIHHIHSLGGKCQYPRERDWQTQEKGVYITPHDHQRNQDKIRNAEVSKKKEKKQIEKKKFN